MLSYADITIIVKKERMPTMLDDYTLDLMKYEIADELGLLEKVRATGWKSLTAKESGRIGGILANRKRKKALK